MALAGTSMQVKVSTTAGGAGTYSLVASIKSASMSINGASIDISAFGSIWAGKIQGLKDTSYSLSGFWEPADTLGQVAIRNALVNDTVLYVQHLPNGTAGFRQEVKVASFVISAAVDGVSEVSIELEGNGVVVAV